MTRQRKPPAPLPPTASDAKIAANLREAVAMVNHWFHVAHYHGLYVEISQTGGQPFLRIDNVCVMRPILPAAPPTEQANGN